MQVLRFVRGHEDALTLVVEVCPLAWLPPGAAQRAARHLKFSALLANQGMWVLRRVVPLARVTADEIDALVDWMVHEANWVRKHGAAFRADARPMSAYVETA